jgi:hypothetical protein
MKLKSILICLFILCCLALQAQTISVKSFRALPMDMTASSLEGKRIDQNGEVAALIRVVTPEKGFVFEGGTLGIVDTKQRVGEIWVWVPRGARKISIMHQQLGVLREYRYPLEIESERTYEMVLTTGKVETIVKQEVTQQYLAFQISPANAVLEVDGELWEVASDGSAMKFVNFGTYNYRVQAPNYHPEIGIVTVNDPENTQKVIVTLKPDFVKVTLKVDADAEIWVNNEKKGIRSWTGNLGKGNYKIECKQVSHETSMIAKEITADMNGQTIDLPKPMPIHGSLNIESTPNFATIYIDGEMVGETPKFIKEIIVGKHELKLTKEGFADHVDTITIIKNEKKRVNPSMNKSQYGQTIVSLPKMNVPEGAINGLFSVSDTKQVYFSQGNLQYQPSTNTWRFAEKQSDMVGDGNSMSNNDWIDLFGWGTSGYQRNLPTNTSTTNSDYCLGYNEITGTNHDWGVNNPISNGGCQTNMWRTLTIKEWDYVFNIRNTYSSIRFAKAKLEGINGVILLPNNWIEDYYNLSETNNGNASFSSNIITASRWKFLEEHGAVFLPASGGRYGTLVSSVGLYGIYWSTVGSDRDYARRLHFDNSILNSNDYGSRYQGISVRLVQDY